MSNTMQKQPEKAQPGPNTQARKPNEQGSIVVQAHMRIFDPATKQVYVEGRA
jgi:hypothetical protein